MPTFFNVFCYIANCINYYNFFKRGKHLFINKITPHYIGLCSTAGSPLEAFDYDENRYVFAVLLSKTSLHCNILRCFSQFSLFVRSQTYLNYLSNVTHFWIEIGHVGYKKI